MSLIALKYCTYTSGHFFTLKINFTAFFLYDEPHQGSRCTPTQNLIISGYPPGDPDAYPGNKRRRGGVAIEPPDSWASIYRHHVRREATSGVEEGIQLHPRAGPRGTASLELLSMYTILTGVHIAASSVSPRPTSGGLQRVLCDKSYPVYAACSILGPLAAFDRAVRRHAAHLHVIYWRMWVS